MQPENTSNNTNFENHEIPLKELIFKIREWYKFILTKWKLIIAVSAIGGAIGFTYAFLQKPIYTAELTFALDEDKSGEGGGLSGALGLASQLGFSLGSNAGGAFATANIMELMKSRKILEKTLMSPIILNGKETSIANYYIDIYGLRKFWTNDKQLNNISFPVNSSHANFNTKQDSILKILCTRVLENNLKILQKDKKVSFTTIEVNSIDEFFAKNLCENIATVLSNFYIEIKSKKAKTNVELLQKQADSLRFKLNYAISGVANANDKIFNLNPAFSLKKISGTLSQIDVQANSAIYVQLLANLEISKVSLMKQTPFIQIIDAPIFPLQKEKMGKLNTSIKMAFLFAVISIIIIVLSNLYKKMIT